MPNPTLRHLLAASILVLTGAAPSGAAVASCIVEQQIEVTRETGARWLTAPAVVVLGRNDDPRLPLVREAVAFWNDTLRRTGSAFRLGAVTVAPLSAAMRGWLPQVSESVLAGARQAPEGRPSELANWCGRIVVALSDDDFISFSRHLRRSGLVLVGIKGNDRFPFALPNVARNVITHELGHAIGLRHNNDPATLMCGRPADCRPTLFESATPRIFPLQDAERRLLAFKYPSNWPNRPRQGSGARDP